MKLTFNVDRKAAIRAGCNQAGEVTVDINVAALSQEDRDELAAVTNNSGVVSAYSDTPDGIAPVGPVLTAAGTDATSLLAAIREAKRAAEVWQAKRRAEEDKELAEIEAADRDILANRKVTVERDGTMRPDHQWYYRNGNYASKRLGELVTRNSPEWAAWLEELERETAARKAAIAAAKEKEQECRRLAELKKEKDRADAQQRLRAWAEVNGSELTRLRLATDYDSWVQSAHDDFVASVMAVVAGDLQPADDYEDVNVEDRLSPTLAEMKALMAARARCEGHPATVELCYVEYGQGGGTTRTELQFRVTCPDGYRESVYYLAPTD